MRAARGHFCLRVAMPCQTTLCRAFVVEANCQVGFGKHRSLTHHQLITRHKDYCDWICTVESKQLEIQRLQLYIEQSRKRHFTFKRQPLSSTVGRVADHFKSIYEPVWTEETQTPKQLAHLHATKASAGFEPTNVTESSQQIWRSCFGIVQSALNLRILFMSSSPPAMKEVTEVADSVLEAMDRFKSHELSMLATAFSVIGPERNTLWCKLALAVQKQPASFNEKQLANLALSFANAGSKDIHLPLVLSGAAVRIIGQLSPQSIAHVAWAFAKSSSYDAKLFDALAFVSLEWMQEFNDHNIAIIAWAFAKAGRNDPKLFSALAASALPRIGEFHPQGLSNMVWANATIERHDPELFDAVAGAVLSRISQLNQHDLANIAWAFAKASQHDHRLFDEVALASLPLLGEFITQGLSNIVWAYATIQRSDAKLFDAVAVESLRKISTFKIQELANLAWAYAKAGRNDPMLFDALASAALRRTMEFNSQELANLAWAFSKSGRKPSPELFDALAAASLQKVAGFNIAELGMLAWAFVQTDLAPTPIVEKFLDSVIACAQKQNWASLQTGFGRQRSEFTEARCAQVVLQLVPDATRNRYILGRVVDIAFHATDGTLINLEIDELYHRTERQHGNDKRRDIFLEQLGVRVVRFDAFDESGREREDLAEGIKTLLRKEGILDSSDSIGMVAARALHVK
ncbi:unnamed protein product [Polarella glacialis]|uniref:RNA-editing substrate-binding complex 6 protein domain-containing protein n=1 Tax=Polarella glacialis TaxID=89957 RepID=A0A813EXG3_POLGL|nr:unnamed protein product [Polarella glacialis]CAE8618954.1 unnamed protein product [Polarella glacialis]CAE8704366.1 unnamed protein product [Polarella glacialis]